MLVLLAVLAALFWLPSPWGLVAVVAALILDLAEIAFGLWYAKRRRPQTGVEALPGTVATVVVPCDPIGQVRLAGELWRAHSDPSAARGERVRVERVDGDLTLHVRPVAADALSG